MLPFSWCFVAVILKTFDNELYTALNDHIIINANFMQVLCMLHKYLFDFND